MRLQICVSDRPISSPSSLPVRINARPIAPRTARSRSFRRRVNCCGFSILPFPFFRATISTDTISCGEICPTRPARCCNIGRGIFMPCVSNQYHAKAKRRNSSAVLCVSLPLLIRATRAFATPLQHFAELFLCVAMPCYALPSYAVASLCFSLPCRRETPPCQTIALPSNAVQFTSLPSLSLLCAKRFSAVASQGHTVASLSDSAAYHC